MSEAVATIQGRKLAARYTLLDKLGAGGQGEVWRAHDGTRGVDIALKVLNPALVQDDVAWSVLEHEYAIASLLDHPAILKVFPPDRSGDVIVLPMELASGGDLRRLRGAGFLEIIPVLLEIAQALEHAHERGVVHRDLKPGNVLFDARGRARLADFGVAERAVTTAEAQDSAQKGAARDSNRQGLSPFTASPAQLRGDPPKPADDIYGLGALAYELLSGYPPYYPHFDRKRAIEEPVPDLVPTRQIPPLLGALVMRMLAKDAARRPRSMREVIDELDAALNDTLTYDFESVSEPIRTPQSHTPRAPAATSAPAPAAIHTPAPVATPTPVARTTPVATNTPAPARPPSGSSMPDLPALFRSAEPAANMSEGPPGGPGWSAGAGFDRRATPDRRAGRTSFLPAAEVRAPSGATRNPDSAGPRNPGRDRRSARTADSHRSGATDRHRGPVSTESAPARSRAQSGPDLSTRTRRMDAGDIELSAAESVEVETGVREAGPGSSPDAGVRRSPRAAVREANVLHAPTEHPLWRAIPLDGLPRMPRLEPIRQRRWPWVFLGLIAGATAAAYLWLPRVDSQTLPAEVSSLITPLQAAIAGNGSPAAPATSQAPREAQAPAAAAATQSAAPAATSASATPEARYRLLHQNLEGRLTMLEERGAGVWGGREFATAKARAAEADGDLDAGNLRVANEHLTSASRMLDSVEAKSPQALIAQIAAGEKALGTGQQEVAGQAFTLARRIDPNDRRASDGQRRAQNLNGVLPLLADAQNAEAAHDYARAAQDYSQALSLDPGNLTAKAGQARSNAAFGDDNYAKAVGSGFAALGAGRLDEAHDDFVKARALKPNGSEAAEGLRRVGAALIARGFASIRQRAAGLEAQERWDEAEQAYEEVLRTDPSLAFAQEGKARASSRAELSGRLQQLIDAPERLSSASVREDARSLLQTADAQSPSGPVLRSQIARLEILLPGFDKPVRLSLLSDNSTQVAISSIGSFGSFSRREIQLRPGRYTVVGTRSGFRDVRREITVAPGQETQTIRVSCSEPI